MRPLGLTLVHEISYLLTHSIAGKENCFLKIIESTWSRGPQTLLTLTMTMELTMTMTVCVCVCLKRRGMLFFCFIKHSYGSFGDKSLSLGQSLKWGDLVKRDIIA